MLITLGGFTFGPQGNGDRHIIEEIDGWFGSPELRQSTQERPGQHGQLLTESQYQGRALLLRGKSLPGSGRTGYEALQALTSEMAAAAAISVPMVVHEPASIGGAKFVVVRKAGRLRAAAGRHGVEWELPLLGQDPRKYSQALKTATITIADGDNDHSGVLTNNGDFPAYPERIYLEGGGAGPLKLGPLNEYISVYGGMTAGQRYVIYPYTRVVLFGSSGAETSSYQNVYDTTRWWEFQPGNTTVFWQRVGTTGGALTATIEYRDAWI